MITIITHVIAFVVGSAGGYWLHYRFGSKLAADANVIKTAVQDMKK